MIHLSLVSGTVLVGLATLFGAFFIKLYRARMLLINRRRQGLVSHDLPHRPLANIRQPVAPNHSFIFGHLLFLKSVLDRLPSGAHYQYGFATIAREKFHETGAFYMVIRNGAYRRATY